MKSEEVSSKFQFFEEELDKINQRNVKEIIHVREVCDRIRRKSDNNSTELTELKEEN